MQTIVKLLKFLFWRRQVIVPLILVWIVYQLTSCATVYVGPAEIGVRQVYYGSGSGIHKETLYTGTHFVVPGYERVHVFPTDLQSLDKTDAGEHSTHEHGRVTEAIHIQTSDGYQVTVDATILYRITDAYLVITKVGPGKLYEDSVVIPRSDQALRKALGELNSEEFYQGPKRLLQTKQAFDALKPELEQKGIQLVKILVRRITYDKAYQHQIEQRKIQDQTVFKNRAEQAAAKEEAHKRGVISTGQAVVRVELEKGKREQAEILADANLYRRQKAAEGDLLVKTAQAQGTELENRALEGAGAQSMVGQRLAEVLRGIKVIIVPSNGPGGTNPLNISDMLRQFEVGK
jgi:regulator of protease activity HflC (stomatin/prohibitin superfamily)